MENTNCMHEFWNKINEAMAIIEDAAVIAKNNEQVRAHLEESSCYEETYEPTHWVIDYLEKMFKDI